MAPLPKPTWFCMTLTGLDANDKIDEDSTRVHMKRMTDAGLGIYLGSGGSGEGHTLDPDELSRLYEIGVNECKGKVPVYANPREVRTAKQMLSTMRLAADAGVEVVQAYQVDPGHGRKPPVGEQEQYFRDILDNFDHPTAISIHTGSGFLAPVDLVIKLCNAYPQIQVVNLHGPNMEYLVELRDSISTDTRIYTGQDKVGGALALGAWGAQDTVANIAPNVCAAIVNEFAAGNADKAGEAWAMSMRIFQTVWGTEWGAVPMVKAVLVELGLFPESGAYVRRPLLKPDSSAVKKVVAELKALNVPELAGFPK